MSDFMMPNAKECKKRLNIWFPEDRAIVNSLPARAVKIRYYEVRKKINSRYYRFDNERLVKAERSDGREHVQKYLDSVGDSSINGSL